MSASSAVCLLVISLLCSLSSVFACTAIIVGKFASVSGAPLTTHNNDCTDCDPRITVVSARDHSKHNETQSAVYPCHFAFPRFIGNDRGEFYTLEFTKKHEQNFFIDQTASTQTWMENVLPIGFIPQAARTYSYLDGSYGIANEYGLAFGESTCAARLVAYRIPYGDALFDVTALSRIALERCKTARCAIQLMGDLAVQYGYYGANDPPEEGEGMFEESGEALTIIDGVGESWIFHILPDDTGKSAIWAAQRVPDDHVALLANKFIIQEMNLNDYNNFMYSTNMVEIAVRNKFWPANSRTPFNFQKAFSPDADFIGGWSDRRTWHIQNKLAPSLRLRADGQHLPQYPFSVKAEKKLSVADVFQLNRDHFEGTPFDLVVGLAAGPYGNPNRYDRSANPLTAGGYFERAISLHRTIYSYVAESNIYLTANTVDADVPSTGVLHFAHHAPHSSVFAPIFMASRRVPRSYEVGNLYHLSRSSSWWAFAAVTNFAEKQWTFITEDVKQQSDAWEANGKMAAHNVSAKIHTLFQQQGVNAETRGNALSLMTDHTVKFCSALTASWWELFDFLLVKYRDGQRMDAFEPPYRTTNLFYPPWWLARVGFYDNGPLVDYINMGSPPPAPHTSVVAVDSSAAVEKSDHPYKTIDKHWIIHDHGKTKEVSVDGNSDDGLTITSTKKDSAGKKTTKVIRVPFPHHASLAFRAWKDADKNNERDIEVDLNEYNAQFLVDQQGFSDSHVSTILQRPTTDSGFSAAMSWHVLLTVLLCMLSASMAFLAGRKYEQANTYESIPTYARS